jgi:hypothetical protein
MVLTDLEGIRRLIAAATHAHQHRGVEQDRMGAYTVTSLGRPKFAELVKLASQNPAALIAMFPSISSALERLAVCEALSEVSDPTTIQFWEHLVEQEVDEELLACAAIGLARQRAVALLSKLEARKASTSSSRLLFHLGVARLLMSDPRGVDYLIELLCRESSNEADASTKVPSHGPTMKFIALGVLKGIFRKGPGEEISQWIDWWSERRDQYKWVDSSVLPSYQLAYVPPLAAFVSDKNSTK